jgi:excisionase family DNA binding protein
VSKRRRSTRTAVPKSTSSSWTLPPPSSARSTLSGSDQQEVHRLAVIEIDNGGSVGSALTLFELAAERLTQPPLFDGLTTAEQMRAEAAALRRQLEEANELAAAAAILRDAELKAAEVRRRLQRTIEAEKRRLHREQRRAEGGLYANQPRAENRPTRLAVDAGAWEVLKGQAVRRRTSVGYLAGELVADVVRHNTLPRVPADDRCVAQQEFASRIAVPDRTWMGMKVQRQTRSTMPSALPQLLDVNELARHLGVNVRHVRRLVAERRIPFIKWGHLLPFDPDEIVDWLEYNRRRIEAGR